MRSDSTTPSNPDARPRTGAGFATTRWTLVVRAGAGSGDTATGRMALEELCRAYWQPVYAFLRRSGRSTHDAQDLTQGFLSGFFEGGSLERVDPAKGRFRSFLLGALQHFLSHERDRERALKRGGGVTLVPLEAPDTEGAAPGGMPAAPGMTPEQAFDRQWALALLDRVLTRLAQEQDDAGKSSQFECLRIALTGDRGAVPYATLGQRLGLSEGAVKVAVHRLRQRYREILRDEIAQTVETSGEVESELKVLLAALGGR